MKHGDGVKDIAFSVEDLEKVVLVSVVLRMFTVIFKNIIFL